MYIHRVWGKRRRENLQMYILAIETTGPIGSVALIDEKGNTVSECSEETMSHLKDLIPMTEKLLKEYEIKKSELSAVAASIGPGSFTGIRIGVATARALSQALQIPAVSVSSLDSFRVKCNGSSLVIPIFNARRGQVYGAVFAEDSTDILAPGPYMLTDVLNAIRTYLQDKADDLPCGMPITETMTFYGDGIDAYDKELSEFEEELKQAGFAFRIIKAEKEVRYQQAELVAKTALKKYEKGEIVSYEKLNPDYMRMTEAEQKLRDGTLAKERAAKMEKFKAR